MKILGVLILVFTLFHGSESHAETLKIYTEEWKPISFSQEGKPYGLAVETVQEILKRLEIKDNIRVVPWARGWMMITFRPNVVLFAMTRTEDREKRFKMVGPVAIGKINLYAKKGRGITVNCLDDARRVRSVGVYISSVEHQVLEKAGFSNLELTSQPLNSAKKLIKGRIDLWCNTNLTTGKLLKDAGHSPNDVENLYTVRENHLYIAMSKEIQDKTVIMWKDALEAMKNDGTFAEIYNKWLPGEIPPAHTEIIGVGTGPALGKERPGDQIKKGPR